MSRADAIALVASLLHVRATSYRDDLLLSEELSLDSLAVSRLLSDLGEHVGDPTLVDRGSTARTAGALVALVCGDEV